MLSVADVPVEIFLEPEMAVATKDLIGFVRGERFQ
jgi:hypothetical protein